MEINKEKIKINYKAIFDYCFRVFVFLVLNNKFFMYGIMNFFSYTTTNIFKFLNFELSIIFLILFWLSYIILTIKLCGIFNKIRNLYLPFALFAIILISILFSYVSPIIEHNHFINIFTDIFFYVLPTCFLVYKVFIIKK